MNKDMEIKSASTIVGRINSARMTDADRLVALSAMRRAEMIVDGFVWVARKIEQIGERLFLKPQLRH